MDEEKNIYENFLKMKTTKFILNMELDGEKIYHILNYLAIENLKYEIDIGKDKIIVSRGNKSSK